MQEEFRDNYIRIGLKISYYRKTKGYTQEELAAKLEVATSFLGQIEAPNILKPISLDTLFRIAKALEIEPFRLLMFD